MTPEALPWLDSPSPERWAGALKLLGQLGALENNELTDLGRRMADIPLHPRLARFLLEVPGLRAATVAVAIHEVLLSQPDVLEDIPPEGPRLEKWLQLQQNLTLRRSLEAFELPPGGAKSSRQR